MARRLLLINLLCLLGIALLAQHLVASWNRFQEEVPEVPAVQARRVELAQVQTIERAEPISSFLIISEKNLFTAERSAAAEAAQAVEETPPELPGDPQLVSVFAVGGEKEAILNVPQGRRGRQVTKQSVRLGDDVLGYEVTQIEDSYVVLSWKNHEVVVEFGETAAEPPKARPGQQAVNIITIGSSGPAVETTQASAEEDEGRGVEVAVAATGPGRTAAGAAARGGMGGLAGARGQTMGQAGMGATGRLGSQRGRSGGMGTMGTMGNRSSRSNLNQRPFN